MSTAVGTIGRFQYEPGDRGLVDGGLWWALA
jgi:hypothetical protein